MLWHIQVQHIIFLESYGHLIHVHAKNGIFCANERLYKIFEQLDPTKFLRISNSVVVAKNQIQKITPTLSMKFILTMSDACRVDVTRTYYHAFKEAFHI